MPSQSSDVGDLEDGVRCNLLLNREIVVLVRRNLEGWGSGGSKIHGPERDRFRAACGHIEVRIGDLYGLDQRRIAERVLLPDAVQCPVVVNAVTASNRGLPIAED